MAKFAVLDNTTGAAGKVVNIALADVQPNAGWILIDGVSPQPQIGWDFTPPATFTEALPDDVRQFYALVTDVQVNAASVIDDNNGYSAKVGDTFEITLEFRRTIDDTIFAINQTRDIIIEGVLGGTQQIQPAAFVAGIGTISIDTTTTGTYEVNETGLNYPINNPANFLDFRAPAGNDTLRLTVTT